MQKVLWVFAHPDDETIAAGLSLRQHLEGGKECHLLACTRGEDSGVFYQLNGTQSSSWWLMPYVPADLGYPLFTRDTFGAARIAETVTAMKVIASGLSNPVVVHEAQIPSGTVTKAAVMAAVQAVYDEICVPGEALWIKSHSDTYEAQPDHLAIGQATRQLAADQPAVFGNLRQYVLPPHWTDTPVAGKPMGTINPAAGTYQSAATLNAARAFDAWNPSGGSFAIGKQSVVNDWVAVPKNVWHV